MLWKGKMEEKRRDEKLYDEMPRRRYYVNGVYKDDKDVYRRVYPYSTNHKSVKTFFSKLSNRTIRRKLRNDNATDRGGHKKLFDLQWKLW